MNINNFIEKVDFTTAKKITGESLVEYTTKKRISEAKSLLKNDDIKLSEVAEKVGYKDYYYFSKLFKKYVGVSPLKYKNKKFSFL